MKPVLFALTLLTALGACRSQDAAPGTDPTTLAGRWQLTQLACYCPAAPVPNEVLTLDEGGTFTLALDTKQVDAGTYGTGRGTPCGSAPVQDLLTTAGYSNNYAYVRSGSYVVSGNSLVITSSSCVADAPVRTYRRLP